MLSVLKCLLNLVICLLLILFISYQVRGCMRLQILSAYLFIAFQKRNKHFLSVWIAAILFQLSYSIFENKQPIDCSNGTMVVIQLNILLSVRLNFSFFHLNIIGSLELSYAATTYVTVLNISHMKWVNLGYDLYATILTCYPPFQLHETVIMR